MISVSIVSHNQNSLVCELLNDLQSCCSHEKIEILLTNNTSKIPINTDSYSSLDLREISNDTPKGFGANHNQAFRQSYGEYFCIVNPDIRIYDNPFPVLIKEMMASKASLVAPAVISPKGTIENSMRYYPTPISIIKKIFAGSEAVYDYSLYGSSFDIDWAAGMFMLFRSHDFKAIGGFDESYYMYYEDVDICSRLRLSGRKVIACPAAIVIHNARYTSHRNLFYMKWHIVSMLRYFIKRLFFS